MDDRERSLKLLPWFHAELTNERASSIRSHKKSVSPHFSEHAQSVGLKADEAEVQSEVNGTEPEKILVSVKKNGFFYICTCVMSLHGHFLSPARCWIRSFDSPENKN